MITFLPAFKVVINCFKVSWCIHYHHCISIKASTVTTLLKVIVEIIYPILQVHIIITAMATHIFKYVCTHTIENNLVNSSKVIGLYVAEALRSSV